MELPDAQAVSDFIRCADLAVAEIKALEHAAEVLSDSLHDAALAFIPLAAKVRPAVLYDFAALYGLTPEAVEAVIREGAERLEARKRDQRAVITAACVAKRAEGQTQQQIADALGISDMSVRRVLASDTLSDANTDCRVRADEEVVAEVQRLAEAGEKQGSIAEAVGISRPRVNQILNGKTGHESKSAPVPTTPSVGSAPRSSDHHHSQPIHLMLQEGSGPNEEMEQNRRRYYDNIRRCFKDIQSINKRLKILDRFFSATYAKEHGGMIANWAAYERIWGPDMYEDELINCSSFDEIRQRLINQTQMLKATINASLGVLQKTTSLPIIIED